MIAAGLLADEPAAGVCTWRKTRMEDFVLCPPEAQQLLLQNDPDADVLWKEQPLCRRLSSLCLIG